MYDDMKFEKMPHVYADNYDCYRKFFPKKNLTQSKKNTSAIERNNCRQRHWLAAFRRRSIVLDCVVMRYSPKQLSIGSEQQQ